MDQETLSVRIFSTASRVLLVFITYALLLVVTSGLVSVAGLVAAPAAPVPGPEPLRALPVVALASAGLLSWMVLRSHWLGAKLAVGVAVAFFGVHTVLPELEALSAPASFVRAPNSAAGSWFGGAVFAATFAVAAVVILGRTGRGGNLPRRALGGTPSLAANALKVAAATALQLVGHVGVGCRSGWYPTLEAVPLPGLIGLFCPATVERSAGGGVFPSAFALVYAALWALAGLVLVRLLSRGLAETSLIVGLFFALAAPVRQLLPLPLVQVDGTGEQRWALAASQLVCGAALALWLAWDGPRFLVRRTRRERSAPNEPAPPPHRARGLTG
ncbi:MAG TPA: hypothetical protein VMG12_29545 [Polyangiaceae bacterium]|nr:hypothetical protein [Polyangiaceae bacterium]